MQKQTAQKILEEIKGLSPQDSINYLYERFLNSIMKKERNMFLEKSSDNKANGFYNRQLINDSSKFDIQVPRDRSNDFRPTFLPDRYQRVYDRSYDKIMNSFIVNGYSKNSIALTLRSLDLPYNEEELERLRDKIHKEAQSFNCRMLKETFFCVLIDGYCCELKDESDGRIKSCVIYVILGIDKTGQKDVIGFYPIFGNESTQNWKEILHNLINRGLKKIGLIISDDFAGLKEVIPTVFPKTDHQLCLVHLQRNIHKHLPKEKAKDFNEDLSIIRKNNDDKAGAVAKFEELCDSYSKEFKSYMELLKSKKNNYFAFKNYPKDMQKYIYSTNAVESFNSMINRVRINNGGFFQSLKTLELNMYLIRQKLISGKWKSPVPNLKKFEYEINQILTMKFN